MVYTMYNVYTMNFFYTSLNKWLYFYLGTLVMAKVQRVGSVGVQNDNNVSSTPYFDVLSKQSWAKTYYFYISGQHLVRIFSDLKCSNLTWCCVALHPSWSSGCRFSRSSSFPGRGADRQSRATAVYTSVLQVLGIGFSCLVCTSYTSNNWSVT